MCVYIYMRDIYICTYNYILYMMYILIKYSTPVMSLLVVTIHNASISPGVVSG